MFINYFSIFILIKEIIRFFNIYLKFFFFDMVYVEVIIQQYKFIQNEIHFQHFCHFIYQLNINLAWQF